MADFWNMDDLEPLTNEAALSTPGILASARFSEMSAYAGSLLAAAQSALDGLANVTIDIPSISYPNVEGADILGAMPLAIPQIGTINDITVADVEFSYSPPDPVTGDLPYREAPVPGYTDPGFAVPDPPDVSWPVFDANAPSVGTPTIPEAPTIDLPPVPQLDSISIPSPPEYSIPEFEWELPTQDLTPPEPQFVWNEAEYDSDIRQMLATKLYYNLSVGGTGLDEATEQAIYDRAKARLVTEEQKAYDTTLEFFASNGFMLPPGALSAQLLEIENKIIQNREDLNNDILVQQSKLAQENTHFIINAAIANEKNLMDYVNQYQNRALEAAKFHVLSVLEVYKTNAEVYKTKIEAYAALAEVYKARIAGEVAKAEFYKAQIEGVKAGVEAQYTLILAYRAQVEAVTTYIELYKAEMEGAKIQAQIDEVRVQAFAGLVQAYSAQVAAATSRYQGYQAQIAGEVAKAEMYKAQVDAYTARVGAYKTEVEADTLVLQQQISINENAIEVFKARVQQYLAQVQAALSQAEIQAKGEGLKVDVFNALVTRYASEIDGAGKYLAASVEEARARAQLGQAQAEASARIAAMQHETAQANIRAAAQVSAQMAAAALAGVSVSSHIAYTESRSDSNQFSSSISANQSSISQVSVSNQNIHMTTD